MSETYVVFVSCESREQGESIAEQVVQEGLAACVNVLPGVRSCYIWEGKLSWSDEVLLLMKTTASGFPSLESRIRELHSYQTPEIIAAPIEVGSSAYLEWVRASVK